MADETENIITEIFGQGLSAIIAMVKALLSVIADQARQIQELEARLNKNSTNSSKPPASDGYRKKSHNNNSRKKSGKPSGGQWGHKGHTLEKSPNPDERIDIPAPDACDNCGTRLDNVEGTTKTRQVFDIPKIIMRIIEYIIHIKICPVCGKVHKTEFPAGVDQPTQYGDNVKSLMCYLTQYQLIPLDRAEEAIEDITGHPVSEGTLVSSANSLSEKLEEPVEKIKQQLIDSQVVGFDETGMHIEGKLNWMHVACTSNLTFYAAHEKRGQEAAQNIGILSKFEGVAVHDHLKSYYSFGCKHAECNAHNHRYLKDAKENYDQDWADEMTAMLFDAKHRREELILAGATEMPQEEILMWHERYHAIIEKGLVEEAEKIPQVLNKKGKPKKSKPLLLLLKLQEYEKETLYFLSDFRLPFTNNQSEQAMRMVKVRARISGTFRSKEGANIFA